MSLSSNIDYLDQALSEYTVEQENYPLDIWNGKILLISDDARFGSECRAVITKIGGRLSDRLPIKFDPATLSEQIQVAAILMDCRSNASEVSEALTSVDMYCAATDTPLIIRTELTVLDAILAQVSCADIDYLLNSDPAELLVSIQTKVQRRKSTVFSNRDEVDIVDLKKISDDVERIARVLAELSGPRSTENERGLIKNPFIEPDTGIEEYAVSVSKNRSKVADVPSQFKKQEFSEIRPFGKENEYIRASTGSVTAKQVRSLIKARRLRDQYFDSALFADPAWDMLLDLLAARLEDTKVSVSSLCIAASVPPTTALRWIKTMTEEKVFERDADTHDGRRVFIELSDEATAGMVGFFSMIKRSKLIMV